MVEEVYNALLSQGCRLAPTIAGLEGPTEVAENASELHLTSATGKEYVLSIIEKD